MILRRASVCLLFVLALPLRTLGAEPPAAVTAAAASAASRSFAPGSRRASWPRKLITTRAPRAPSASAVIDGDRGDPRGRGGYQDAG